ncbi:MFS transporter [Dictyobacter arantiisoli]|uniref:MFS transporter n=1 Tax=Dictyobacter arantiisoli TaxID=2014874 RepID=A0A5A5TK97_9CHLR|nr:MFS transporter [Dictyobacter arantiisoli]GCF11459.1 MFS transporter [Dictyobacter arantiisoli]
MFLHYNHVDRARIRMARLAVVLLFFFNGTVIATWAARIPAIQAKLGLPPGQLGIALLGSAVGALVAMNVSSRVAARFGSAVVTLISGICLCMALVLLSLAPNLPWLVLALFFFGASNGSMDVTMNMQGSAVEQDYGSPIFSSFHAFYSVGALLGAFAGGIFATYAIDPFAHFVCVAVIALLGMFVCARFLLPASAVVTKIEKKERARKAFFVRPSRLLVALALISFCALVSEGAMSDWSAVYLANTAHSGAGLAAAGYAVFSLCMAIGRGVGDYMAARLGPSILIRICGLLAALGLALGLIFPWTPLVLLGLGCVGLGLSVLFPLVLSAAGRLFKNSSETAISTLATCGYTGFLVGPPVIGFVADHFGLRISLGFVVLLCLITASLAGVTASSAPTTVSTVQESLVD